MPRIHSNYRELSIHSEKIFVMLFAWYISIGPVVNWNLKWNHSAFAQCVDITVHAFVRTLFTVCLSGTCRFSYRSEICTRVLRWLLNDPMIHYLELPVYSFSIWLYGEIAWPTIVKFLVQNSGLLMNTSMQLGLLPLAGFILISTLMELLKKSAILGNDDASNCDNYFDNFNSREIPSSGSPRSSRSEMSFSAENLQRNPSDSSLINLSPTTRSRSGRETANHRRRPSLLLEELVDGVGVKPGYTRSGIFYK